MQAFAIRPGLELRWADFQPAASIEQRIETRKALLRFHFHLAGSGRWELRSPFGRASRNEVTQFERRSSVLFYPELEGKFLFPAARRQFHLSISITPSLLSSYLGNRLGPFPEDLRAIGEGCLDRAFGHSGPLSHAMTSVFHQLIHCPYSGPLKQLFIESKALELVTHKLAQIASAEHAAAFTTPEPDDLERIHQAQMILGRNLERPPRLSDLAHRVGTNHTSLNLSFRRFCGTTVFGYLRQLRLEKARQLMEREGLNVTEAALSVGYNSLPSFSRAFSDHFGLNPATCRKKRPPRLPVRY